MSWSSFWYHLCAIPLEVRTVNLVLFLQAFALLSVLHCLPAVRHADHVFSSAVYHNYRAPSEHSYSGFTPNPPYKQYAWQDLINIGDASPSSASPPSLLLIVHLRHLGITHNLPQKPWRSRRGGRNKPRKIKVRISGSDRPPRGPTIDYTPTEPEPHHHPSRPDSITATVTAAKLRSLSYSSHQLQGNLIRVNPTQKDDRLVVSIFNTQSVGPEEKWTEIVKLSKMVLTFCFWQEAWMKTHSNESKCVDSTRLQAAVFSACYMWGWTGCGLQRPLSSQHQHHLSLHSQLLWTHWTNSHSSWKHPFFLPLQTSTLQEKQVLWFSDSQWVPWFSGIL